MQNSLPFDDLTETVVNSTAGKFQIYSRANSFHIRIESEDWLWLALTPIDGGCRGGISNDTAILTIWLHSCHWFCSGSFCFCCRFVWLTKQQQPDFSSSYGIDVTIERNERFCDHRANSLSQAHIHKRTQLNVRKEQRSTVTSPYSTTPARLWQAQHNTAQPSNVWKIHIRTHSNTDKQQAATEISFSEQFTHNVFSRVSHKQRNISRFSAAEVTA